MSEGRLFYVVGASGAGKDSLIAYARDALCDASGVAFARRYITRPADAGGEDHIALTQTEFLLRRERGLFAMEWESNGLSYGVGIEIDAWLEKGYAVVVNGSRSYVGAARSRYPEIRVVWVSAEPEVLAARLTQRGRESQPQIRERLRRNASLGVHPPADTLHIANDGLLEVAGGRLVALLTGRHV